MELDAYQVNKLVVSDIEATAGVLARAFSDNACYAFIHGRAPDRARSLRGFFRRNLDWHRPLELTWVARSAAGEVLGTFTLEPPRGVPSTLLRALRHWAVPTYLEEGFETLRRLVLSDEEFKAQYTSMCAGRGYWHVHAVAVAPEHQGRGIGHAMLRTALEALEHLTCARPAAVVLSTQREKNLPFYRAHGFELCHEATLGQARGEPGYRSWFMRHPALSRQASSRRASWRQASSGERSSPASSSARTRADSAGTSDLDFTER
jgi:ribosomal protein S18 acetylase RimI-like enzyme